MLVGLTSVFVFVVATFVRVNCAYACLVLVLDGPSMQARRAETRVERFTARSHIGIGAVPGKICFAEIGVAQGRVMGVDFVVLGHE